MKHTWTKSILVGLLALLMFGCSESPNPIGSKTDGGSTGLEAGKIAFLSDGDLVSATFNIWAEVPSNGTVTIHRVTAPWDEYAVTWNSFGGAYDPEIQAAFQPSAIGWYEVDVTGLVASWLNGDAENFGLLMKQRPLEPPRTMFWSREEPAYAPHLEICVTTEAGVECTTFVSVADAYIFESNPDVNKGMSPGLFTGWVSLPDLDLEKQSLVRFEFPVPPPPASLGDFVWIDENRNGIQDAGEPGYPDAIVNLLDCQGEFIASTTTDGAGNYLFDGLTPGGYQVQFVAPEGYAFTLQNQGTDPSLDSDADPGTGLVDCVVLGPGEHNPTLDAGVYLREMEGCSLTKGFWKNHAGFGPQADVVTPLLPIWLGDPGDDNASIHVLTARIAVDVLKEKTYGTSSNGITKLYSQLLAAKLNAANGADISAVADVIADADAFLAEHNWEDWGELSKSTQRTINGWKSTLDSYNNGDIGPGHCD